jgi:hypothetical protein
MHVEPDSKLLFCVRDPKRLPNFGNMLSTPTLRIEHRRSVQIIASTSIRSTLGAADPLLKSVTKLMRQRLGVRGPLKSGGLQFKACFSHTIEGVVEDRVSGTHEPIRMINIMVNVTKGASCFKSKTRSYKVIGWARAADFLQMWNEKDLAYLGFTGQTIMSGKVSLCETGLCIRSTADFLAQNITGGLP